MHAGLTPLAETNTGLFINTQIVRLVLEWLLRSCETIIMLSAHMIQIIINDMGFYLYGLRQFACHILGTLMQYINFIIIVIYLKGLNCI